MFRSTLRPFWMFVFACLIGLSATVAACGDGSGDRGAGNASPPAAVKPVTAPGPAPEPAPGPNDGLIAVNASGLVDRVAHSGQKGVLVAIWASWCGPCKQELPMLIAMAGALHTEGVGLMLLSADEPKDRAAAAAFFAQAKAPAPGFIAAGDFGAFKRLLAPWRGAIPSTFLFDGTGTLRYTWTGPTFDYEIQPIVDQFLAGEPLPPPATTAAARE